MKNLESKIYDVLKEAGVPVKQAKKMAKKTTAKKNKENVKILENGLVLREEDMTPGRLL